jgi:excisionase family DNA binding protein
MQAITAGTQGEAMSPEQLARQLGLVRATVLRQIRCGKLGAHKIGNVWRILPADVDRFLARTSNQRV